MAATRAADALSDCTGIGGRNLEEPELLYTIPVPVLGLGLSFALNEREGRYGEATAGEFTGSDAFRMVLDVIEGTGTAGRSPPLEAVLICLGSWRGRTGVVGVERAVGGVETDDEVEEKVRARGKEGLEDVVVVDEARLAFDDIFLKDPGRVGRDLSLLAYDRR
jgi:hypothetical protein